MSVKRVHTVKGIRRKVYKSYTFFSKKLSFLTQYVQPITQYVQPLTQYVQSLTQYVQPLTINVQKWLPPQNGTLEDSMPHFQSTTKVHNLAAWR